MYSLYLYFLGLSLRNTSKVLEPFKDEKEVTYLSGIGFKDLVLSTSITNTEEFLHSIF
jgi:hypothetical protein